MTVPALLSTKAGRVVRRLRGRQGEVGRLATIIVTDWKRLVLEYEVPTVTEEQEEVDEKEVQEGDEGVLEKTGLASQTSVKEEEQEDAKPSCNDNVNVESLTKKEEDPKVEVGEVPEWEDQVEEQVEEVEEQVEEMAWDDPPQLEDLDMYDNFAQAEDPDLWDSFNDPGEGGARPASRPTTPLLTPRPATPVDRRLMALRRATPSPCTPLPDYAAMLSPQLKAELQRFGLKAVPRRKAAQLLHHIYERTHPLVAASPSASPRPSSALSSRRRSLAKATARRIPTTAPRTTLTNIVREEGRGDEEEREGVSEEEEYSDVEEGSQGSQDSQYSARGPAEESMVEGVEEEAVAPNLHQQLAAFIRARPSLHQRIVVYEPLWLHQFLQDVKEAGVRCSMVQVRLLAMV